MKETFYFQHDYNARNDPKLQDVLIEHGAAGLGVFWCIVEQLYEQGGVLPLKSCKSIAFALHQECTTVESIVKDFGLFENDGENFWSNSVNNRLGKRQSIREKRKAAAIIRWQSAQKQQTESTSNASAMQNDAKERKEKEIKDNTISNDIEREKPQKRFVPPTLEEVQAYILEKGYSVDAESFIAFYQCKNWYVGKNKMKDWKAAILTWEKRERENPRRPARPTKSSKSRNANDEWQ